MKRCFKQQHTVRQCIKPNVCICQYIRNVFKLVRMCVRSYFRTQVCVSQWVSGDWQEAECNVMLAQYEHRHNKIIVKRKQKHWEISYLITFYLNYFNNISWAVLQSAKYFFTQHTKKSWQLAFPEWGKKTLIPTITMILNVCLCYPLFMSIAHTLNIVWIYATGKMKNMKVLDEHDAFGILRAIWIVVGLKMYPVCYEISCV